MAKVIPLRELDIDLKKLGVVLPDVSEERDRLNKTIESLTYIQEIYTKIRVLTRALGFAVKEYEFSKNMILELDKITDKIEDDDSSYSGERSLYQDKQEEASKVVESKASELRVELAKLDKCKEQIDSEAKRKDLNNIETIISVTRNYMQALDIDVDSEVELTAPSRKEDEYSEIDRIVNEDNYVRREDKNRVNNFDNRYMETTKEVAPQSVEELKIPDVSTIQKEVTPKEMGGIRVAQVMPASQALLNQFGVPTVENYAPTNNVETLDFNNQNMANNYQQPTNEPIIPNNSLPENNVYDMFSPNFNNFETDMRGAA